MKDILIFGHKKPDTDSVVASISLSYLKNKLGFNTSPRVLGHINRETKFVLNYFNVLEPKYLNDVKLQIRDIAYYKNCFLNENESVYKSYLYMKKNGITGVPYVDNNKIIKGIITNKMILKEAIDNETSKIETSYKNILTVIEGKEILKFDDEIKGEIIAASYRSTTFKEEIILDSNMILVVGNRPNILEYAIKSKVKMIIVVGSEKINEEFLREASLNKVNIISTNFFTFDVAKRLSLSNYVKNVVDDFNYIYIKEKDYVNDFLEINNKYKHSNYPVIDSNNHCLGLLRIGNIYQKVNKKVILVDHNEKAQSVDGLEEAEILEIVDHHKLGDITTKMPIDIKTMPVGSTNTIIFNMFKDNDIAIPPNIAGIMLGAIISDTLLFKSPTSTYLDKQAAKELQEICGVDYNKFGNLMFKEGSSLIDKTYEEVLYDDFKIFNIDNKKVGIGQVLVMDYSLISNEFNNYINLLNSISKKENYDVLCLFVIDINRNGSYILYNDLSKGVLENSFNVDELSQGYFLDKCISRKKQIIPKLIDYLDKK